ncbi:hypothetical protein, partial [Phenylobacterium sp.]|uniref:hypothetical protein n=1 Tax=Phenylobacterium sp. TaxID=1871053 RepID=UPI002E34A62A
MANQKARPLASLKRRARGDDTSESIGALAEELKTASDRAVAVVVASILDRSLEDALLGWMRTLSAGDREALFSTRGVLASFSAKIDLAFAFKIYGPNTRADLHTIREIRNLFAHARLTLSFSDEAIARAIYSLHLRKKASEGGFVYQATSGSDPPYCLTRRCYRTNRDVLARVSWVIWVVLRRAGRQRSRS